MYEIIQYCRHTQQRMFSLYLHAHLIMFDAIETKKMACESCIQAIDFKISAHWRWWRFGGMYARQRSQYLSWGYVIWKNANVRIVASKWRLHSSWATQSVFGILRVVRVCVRAHAHSRRFFAWNLLSLSPSQSYFFFFFNSTQRLLLKWLTRWHREWIAILLKYSSLFHVFNFVSCIIQPQQQQNLINLFMYTTPSYFYRL